MRTTDDENDLGVVKGEASPVTLDFSSAIPITPLPVEQRARALQSALFYAAQHDSEQYARLLRIQELTGIPPIVSAGNETEIEQWVNATRIDPHAFTVVAPRIAAWASNPDNAAVAGAREIQRLGGVEQNAAAMRAAALHALAMRSVGVQGAAESYAVTATNPDTQHQIGTNDGGRTWNDVQTGEKVH